MVCDASTNIFFTAAAHEVENMFEIVFSRFGHDVGVEDADGEIAARNNLCQS